MYPVIVINPALSEVKSCRPWIMEFSTSGCRVSLGIQQDSTSGSGLDPHISPKAAEVQIETVAKNSGLSEEKVKEIVKSHTEEKFLGIFGEEKVNVLKCNLDIAAAMGII